jgi:hypothetical protein
LAPVLGQAKPDPEVGHLKGVGKVYLQTVIDGHTRYAWARLYTNKLPLTAVPTLNNEVLPPFEEHGARIEAVLSNNSLPRTRSGGRAFCGREDQHPYALFLQREGLAHKTTKVAGRSAMAL